MLIEVFAHDGDPTAIATAAPHATTPARTSSDAFMSFLLIRVCSRPGINSAQRPDLQHKSMGEHRSMMDGRDSLATAEPIAKHLRQRLACRVSRVHIEVGTRPSARASRHRGQLERLGESPAARRGLAFRARVLA